jgi:hypothetical protein
VDLGWQDLVAIGIVALAALYLSRLALGALMRKQADGCGTACGKCLGRGHGNISAPEQVVKIGTMPGFDGQ